MNPDVERELLALVRIFNNNASSYAMESNSFKAWHAAAAVVYDRIDDLTRLAVEQAA